MTSTGEPYPQLTLFAEDTPANHSATPAQETAQTTQDTSGHVSPTAFAYFDHDLRCWKTCQATFHWDLEKCKPIWPRSGTTQNGIAYQQQPSAHRTCETEYSSLLWTPTATANYSAPSMKARNGNDGYSNPEWVEWLMGFPIGWTDLEDSETP